MRSRYTATLVQDDAHYIRSLIYIAMNPVKAGFCRRPEDWEWGSWRSRTLARSPDKLLRDFVDISLA